MVLYKNWTFLYRHGKWLSKAVKYFYEGKIYGLGNNGSLLCHYIFLGKTLKSELAPLEDKSGFRLAVSAPEGTSYDAMDKYMDKLTNFFIDSLPEKRYVTSMTAPGFISEEPIAVLLELPL